ncbi:hypothetical protein SRHO_G00254140 [Serrasalmus rhombeus]
MVTVFPSSSCSLTTSSPAEHSRPGTIRYRHCNRAETKASKPARKTQLTQSCVSSAVCCMK